MYTDDDGYTGSELNLKADTRTCNGARKTVARDGTVYQYNMYNSRKFPTGLDGFLTGMLSVGIGEIIMPQLVKEGKVHSHTMEKSSAEYSPSSGLSCCGLFSNNLFNNKTDL